MIPSYEELKEMTDYKTYLLYFPVIGGYFRLTRNEDGKNTIALDYLEGGYLTSIIRRIDSDYILNKLYKFNKKNYTGLTKLYVNILEMAYKDLKEELGKYKEVK